MYFQDQVVKNENIDHVKVFHIEIIGFQQTLLFFIGVIFWYENHRVILGDSQKGMFELTFKIEGNAIEQITTGVTSGLFFCWLVVTCSDIGSCHDINNYYESSHNRSFFCNNRIFRCKQHAS